MLVQVKGTNDTVKFPDDMTREQIREVLAKRYSQGTPSSVSNQDALTPKQSLAMPYERTLAEKAKQKIADTLYDNNIISDRYGAQRIGDNLSMGLGMLPVLGDAEAGDEFGRAAAKGDALGMGLASIGAFPLAGKAAKKVANVGVDYLNNAGVNKVIKDTPMIDRIVAEAPIIDPQSLVGLKIKPTFADLTAAGRSYKGIDGSKIDQPIELQGGADFPLLESYDNNRIVWAANSDGAIKKLQKGDVIAVNAMDLEAHKSNATFNQAYLSTVEAYVRDGRINQGQLGTLDSLVEKSFPSAPKHGDLQRHHDWVESLTFDERSKLMGIYKTKTASNLNLPNFKKVLNATMDKKFAGTNLGDTMLLIRVDKGADAKFELGTSGTKKHRSYKYGVTGEVLGRLPKPVSKDVMFSEFLKQRRIDGKPQNRDVRSLSFSLPEEEFTQAKADLIGTSPYNAIKSPRQAQLAQQFIDNKWSDTRASVKDGGVSVTEFIDNINSSEASASLSQYNPKELSKKIKNGDMSIFKLGDGNIYFGLENNYNYASEYSDYADEFAAAGFTGNEKAVVGVVNNELGAKGVGGTSVMLKALEEGATVLDAFAVKSAKFPDGFLPELYGEFGFKTKVKMPFDESYYDKNQMADLKELWSKSGWKDGDPYPDIEVMKWSGDENARKSIQRDWLNAVRKGDESSFIGKATNRSLVSAEKIISKQSGVKAGQIRGKNNPRNNTGGLRDSDRTPSTLGFGRLVNEVESLTELEKANLKIK